MSTRSAWRVVLAVALAADLALTAVLFRSDVAHRDLLWLLGATGLGVLAVVAVPRVGLGDRRTVWVVVGAGALLQCAALVHGPLTSDDFFRYVWDGRVQLAGIDPYRYAPSAPELAGLRDGFLFGPGACAHPFAGGCTAINRPDVHTIYPPVAEAAFVVLRLVSFGGAFSYQLWAAAGTVVVTAVLVRLLRRLGRPVWLAAVWAWSPLVVTEYGNNAHIDWLAVLFSLLAVGATLAGRAGRAGAWVGAAAAVKLYPALLLVALVRRRPVVVLAAAAAVFVLGYVPHVAAVGSAVVGYLPGYLHEEGYASGTRLLVLGAVLPHGVDTVVGAAVLLAVGAWCVRHADAADPSRTAVVFVGTVFLVVTPSYGWYAGLLLALAAVSGRWEWSAVALAPTTVYLVYGDLSHATWPGTLAYVVAGAVVATVSLTRMKSPAKPSGGRTVPGVLDSAGAVRG